ncbi:FAS1 domain-containing protein [Xylariales sp. PMI_506]|nr:FAS1 domain-containing protein [Xylariales sp. PMI_506]
MRYKTLAILLVNALQGVLSQDDLQTNLESALSNYPDLSTFRELLVNNTQLVSSVLSDYTGKVTVLVPDNEAFTNYFAQNGPISSISNDQILAVLQYHFMVTELTGTSLGVNGGVTVPTLLQDLEHNNRSASSDIQTQFGPDANGQVIFASPGPLGSNTITVRAESNVELRGGLAQDSNLQALDAQWEGGIFHAIDTVLIPPAKCSTTTRSLESSLSSLDTAMNRTQLWSTLDHTQNVTCLAPSNAGFTAAGNPQENLSDDELTQALLFHTLTVPAYTNFLEDGQEFKSYTNMTVRVSIQDGEIYFNDAKVVSQNVLTNNGLIHILDKVMSPLNDTSGSSTTTTGSPTATKTSAGEASSTTSANPGVRLYDSPHHAGLVAFVMGAILIL